MDWLTGLGVYLYAITVQADSLFSTVVLGIAVASFIVDKKPPRLIAHARLLVIFACVFLAGFGVWRAEHQRADQLTVRNDHKSGMQSIIRSADEMVVKLGLRPLGPSAQAPRDQRSGRLL